MDIYNKSRSYRRRRNSSEDDSDEQVEPHGGRHQEKGKQTDKFMKHYNYKQNSHSPTRRSHLKNDSDCEMVPHKYPASRSTARNQRSNSRNGSHEHHDRKNLSDRRGSQGRDRSRGSSSNYPRDKDKNSHERSKSYHRNQNQPEHKKHLDSPNYNIHKESRHQSDEDCDQKNSGPVFRRYGHFRSDDPEYQRKMPRSESGPSQREQYHKNYGHDYRKNFPTNEMDNIDDRTDTFIKVSKICLVNSTLLNFSSF